MRLISHTFRRRLAATLGVTLLGLAVIPAVGAAGLTRPSIKVAGVAAVPSASLPATNCNPNCDLWASAGWIDEKGAPLAAAAAGSVNIWGFSIGTPAAKGIASIPGPVITVIGASATINFHNALGEPMFLEFPALTRTATSAADPVANGASKTYSLTGLVPGTYVYQAGSSAATPDADRQVAMGLSGILIVRPAGFTAATQTAYPAAAVGGAASFQAEATVALNEVDPEFNNSQTIPPTAANVQLDKYDPSIFLLNGRSFDPSTPATAALGKINVANTDTLLLRYANLGLRERTVTLAGHHQTVHAQDSHVINNQLDKTAVFLTSGQTTDTVVTIDPTVPVGTKVALYESGMHLADDATLGGAMTYLDVVGGALVAASGPATDNVTITPKLITDVLNSGTTGPLTATATFAAGTTSAEYFIDKVGVPGTGAAFPLAGVTFANIAAIAGSPGYQPGDGNHTIWVHAFNGTTWGYFSGDAFDVKLGGPIVSSLSVSPNPTSGINPSVDPGSNGPNDLQIRGTASASVAGWVITDAQFCVDTAACATPVTMDITPPATVTPPAVPGDPTPPGGAEVVQVHAALTPAQITALGTGVHTIFVRAYEQPTSVPVPVSGGRYGAWGAAGAASTISFHVDLASPVISGLAVTPNPAGGGDVPGNGNITPIVKVSVHIDDSGAAGGSNIVMAEAFVGGTLANAQAQAPGSGAEAFPAGGVWSITPTTDAYFEIPLPVLLSYPEGQVPIYVRAKDAAGNWSTISAATSITVLIDKTKPLITATALATVLPSPGNRPNAINVTAVDPVGGLVAPDTAALGIYGVEWFTGIDPGAGVTGITVGETAEAVGAGPGVNVDVFPFTPIVGGGVPGTFVLRVGPQAPGTVVYVRVKDHAGNWSGVTPVTFP